MPAGRRLPVRDSTATALPRFGDKPSKWVFTAKAVFVWNLYPPYGISVCHTEGQQKLGSARESDEVPNWRGFHGFGSPAEVGRFCDCGLTAANRPTGCRSRKLARLSHPPRGMGIAGASPEIFHPMKVDKLFPRWRAPFEGPRLLPLAETCGGGRNRARPERARQFERLAERQLPLWLSPSRGVWNPYEAPVSIGSRAIQPH